MYGNFNFSHKKRSNFSIYAVRKQKVTIFLQRTIWTKGCIMNVLIWGSDTILGHGLASMLKDIKDGIFSVVGNIEIGEIFTCDANSDMADIDEACANADFVFNTSYGFKSDKLIESLDIHNNTCPVLLSHSVGDKSLFREYAQNNNVSILEWAPNYDMELLSVEAQVYDMIGALQCA